LKKNLCEKIGDLPTNAKAWLGVFFIGDYLETPFGTVSENTIDVRSNKKIIADGYRRLKNDRKQEKP